MRKGTREKERYYHVYSKDSTASHGVVMKVYKSNLECMTKGISRDKMKKSCDLSIENGILKSSKEFYVVTEISKNRAYKKIEASKYGFSPQNWND